MKEHRPIREVLVTAGLALLLGFFLAAGATLNGGGYLGYGVEHAAAEVWINWLAPEIYLSSLVYALPVFVLLWLLWRALDSIAAARARKLSRQSSLGPAQQRERRAGSFPVVLPEMAPAPSSEKRRKRSRASLPGILPVKKRWFWIAVILLLGCWVPFWLALWPGIYNYDAHYQYEMLLYAELQTHHPLVHTFLLNGLVLLGEYYLGGVNTGVELYIGLSLVVCALTFAWMLYTMAEEGAGKPLILCSFLFLAINPALVVWLISTNKDVLFTALLLLAALVLYRACRLRGEELGTGGQRLAGAAPDPFAPAAAFATTAPSVLRIGFATALVLFLLVIGVLAFRTSAVYSCIVFLPFAALLIRKHLRVRLVGVLATATAVFAVAYIVLTQILFSVPAGPWQTLDALSIPRQQLARVWIQANEGEDSQDWRTREAFEYIFDEEDREYLDLYEADDADPSRTAFRRAFEQDPLGLLTLYVAMGSTHPGAYTDAALLTCYEAWYPGAVMDGYVMESYFAKPDRARASYIDVSAFWPAEEAWILDEFGSWLKEFGLGNLGMDLPPVRLLCSPATYVWILLITLARTICVSNRRGALVCVLLLCFCLTALLSPLVVMRYFLMVMAATPLLLHIASSSSWSLRKREDRSCLDSPPGWEGFWNR
ncbi:MAG: DUF6020 family protein [Coriobacteriales bacterium]|jgi:hypothetical protein|nr:DUF6020 family protein [Coriobacteriales bacterium]